MANPNQKILDALDLLQIVQNQLNCCLENNSCLSYCEAADGIQAIMTNYSSLGLPNEHAKQYFVIIFRGIIQPFAARVIEINNENISLRMISFIQWWLIQKHGIPDNIIFETIRDHLKTSISKIKECAMKPNSILKKEPELGFDYVFQLFKIKTFGKDIDKLIWFIDWYFKKCIESSPNKTLSIEFNSNIKDLWKMYFNPLCIESVNENGEKYTNLIGKQSLISLGTDFNSQITINWSDKRSDIISSLTYERQRADHIIHSLFNISSTEKCMEMLNNIPTETILNDLEAVNNNEALKIEIVKSLRVQFGRLLNEFISKQTYSLISKTIEILNNNYSFLFESTEFVESIANIILKYPLLMENKHVEKFFSSFIRSISDDILTEHVHSLFKQLELITKDDGAIRNKLHLTNVYLKEISKRNIKFSSSTSFDWIKNKSMIENYETHELLYEIITELLAVATLATFLQMIEIYLSTGFNIYIKFLAKCLTTQTFKTIKENLKQKDYLRFHEMQIKLSESFKKFGKLEDLKFSLQIFVKYSSDCLDVIQNDSNLKEKFTEKQYLDLLIDAIETFKSFEKINVPISAFNFLLNLTAISKLKKEIIVRVVDDVNTFGKLYNCDNMFLLLNLLHGLHEEETGEVDLLKIFIEKTIKAAKENKEISKSFFTSLIESLAKVNDKIEVKVLNYLRGFIGVFIEMLLEDDFKKIAIEMLCKLLNFNEKEEKTLASYFGIESLNKTDEKLNGEDEINALFFSTECKLKKNKKKGGSNELERIARNDFDEVIESLKENIKILENKSKVNSSCVTLIAELEEKFQKGDLKNSLNFIWTETTKENVKNILQANVSPILLEGGTGIGKSATVQVAADVTGNTLIRFNMSSRVTIDDFLGKVVICRDNVTNKDKFEFKLSLFSKAFKEGTWLLLDEMNLAQDNVLQCIENALDSRTLILHNPCNASKSVELIPMHEKFRLFATQNPSVGFFKGKREKLSKSLLDRFTVYCFDELPIDEWKLIAENRLIQRFSEDDAKKLSKFLVEDVHLKIKNVINEKKFQEKAAYSEITIRDLFKLVERLLFLKKNNYYTPLTSTSLKSYSVFLTYASRFRESGRDDIMKLMHSIDLRPNVETKKCTLSVNEIIFDDIKIKNYRETSNSGQLNYFGTISDVDMRVPYLSRITLVHKLVEKKCFSLEFIKEHGLYMVDNNWMLEWFNEIKGKSKDEWNFIGFSIYMNKFRHQGAKEKIRDCFMEAIADNCFDISKVKQNLTLGSRPFVITNHVLNIWKQIAWNLESSYPILVTGYEGCGKTETVFAFSQFIGMELTQVCLTPETEASHLVGQHNPNDGGSGEKIIWQDGFVTKAFKKGNWLLLDNFNQGDSCVLERLNPLLENDPVWVLTENQETEAINKKENFKVFATMTIANNKTGNKTLYPELSPALYNRFSIIHMENDNFKEMNGFKEEIRQLAKYALDVKEKTMILNDIAEICWLIHQKVNLGHRYSEYGVVTLRNYVRFIDVFYILSNKHPQIGYRGLLWKCYKVCFESQFKFPPNMSQNHDLCKQVRDYLGIKADHDEFRLKNTFQLHNPNKYVLTDSRTEFFETVLTCIECGIPILLEGPAAVGKTALISWLCENPKYKKKLLRVNNNESTSVQDYIGSYIPNGNQFSLQKGSLYIAMELGHWFLADEFNLADPSVMTTLLPLLEGRKKIEFPGINHQINVNSEFRFFATQNDAAYANRHQLPISLRNRFLEVQVTDFDVNELKKVIIERDKTIKSTIISTNTDIDEKNAGYIANVYKKLRNLNINITLREIIKWLRREKNFEGTFYHLTGYQLLSSRYIDENMNQDIARIFIKAFELNEQTSFVHNNTVSVQEIGGNIILQYGALRMSLNKCILSNSPLFQNDRLPPEPFLKSLVRLGFAALNKEPVLIVGPSSYKSLLIQTWNLISNDDSNLKVVHLTSDTDNSNLIGQIQPYSYLDVLKYMINIGMKLMSRFKYITKANKMTIDNKDDDLIAQINKILSKETEGDTLYQILNKLKLLNKDANEKKKLESDCPIQVGEVEKDIPINDNMFSSEDEDDLAILSRRITKNEFKKEDSIEVVQVEGEDISQFQPVQVVDTNNNNNELYDDGLGSFTAVDLFGFSSITTEPNPSDNLPASNFYTNVDSTLSAEVNEIVSNCTKQETEQNGDDLGFCGAFLSFATNNVTSGTDTARSSPTGIEKPGDFLLQKGLETLLRSRKNSIFDTKETELIKNLKNISEKLISTIKELLASVKINDAVIDDYFEKINFYLMKLSDIENKDKTFFLFKEGAVTECVKDGKQILLEDFDLPSQAVTERLNSLLEPDRSFTLNEDIICNFNDSKKNNNNASTGELPISQNFQIFATIHVESDNQKLNISPATLSRFTEIRVSAYNKTDIQKIVQQELLTKFHQMALEASKGIIELRNENRNAKHWDSSNDLHVLLKLTEYICKEVNGSKTSINTTLKSKFNEITKLKKYISDDIETIIKPELDLVFKQTANEISNKILKLREEIVNDALWNQMNDIHILFKLIDFICNDFSQKIKISPAVLSKIEIETVNESDEIDYKILLGSKFFYFERFKQYDAKKFKNIALNWYNSINTDKIEELPKRFIKLFDKPALEDGAYTGNERAINNEKIHIPQPIDLLNDGKVKLKYTGLTIEPKEGKYDDGKFYCTPTSTFVLQVARIFASIISGSALLLEGPPGVGKTAVVDQVCSILNMPYERINFSGNTAVDQLFGSIIPQSNNSKREFQWRDGKITKAIKAGKWLLLDEINLASSEVLQTLTPLLARNLRSFTIPGSDEVLTNELKNIRIFATMNPVNIGGGRAKLPRSIENLFTIVSLEEYNRDELRMIIIDLFAEAIKKKLISLDLVFKLYDLHLEIKEKYSRREIGKYGGPYEFNLREIAKFKDILIRNAEDQAFHYRFMVDLVENDDDSDITTISVRKFAELVYASQFHYSEDQKIVRQLIENRFPVKMEYLKESSSFNTIDDTVVDSIRIGSIYLAKGTTMLTGEPSLIHSKETVKQLELLAAACQSRRSVLLEGDTCSRKTGLVQELARLTNNKLVIVSLNQDTETSDLIGHWVPDKDKKGENQFSVKINEFFEEILKLWILFGFSQLDEKERFSIGTKVRDAYEFKINNNNNNSDKSLESSIEALTQLKVAIDELLVLLRGKKNSAKDYSYIFENCRYRVEFFLSTVSKQIELEKSNTDISFVFIESEFINAIRMGHWVLLDNVNSAPPEIIERINSLLEEKPTLNIYEYHDGEELTRDNQKIHENFRIFCTSNSQRESSNKLSTAFLNRVIRIWLPKIDDGLEEEKIKEHEVYELTKNLFFKLNLTSSQLPVILTQYHAIYQQLLRKKLITQGDDTNLTFRRILKTFYLFQYSLKQQNKKPLQSLIHSISNNYSSALERREHKTKAINSLIALLDKLKNDYITSTSTIVKSNYFSLVDDTADIEETHESMISLEGALTIITYHSLINLNRSTDRSFILSKILQFATTIVLPLNIVDKKVVNEFIVKIRSNSSIDLIQELSRLDALFNKRKLDDFGQNHIDEIIESVDDLENNLLSHIQKSTLSNFKTSKKFVERIINIVERYWSILSSVVDQVELNNNKQLVGILNQILPKIEEILCFKNILNWFKPFESSIFEKLNENLNNSSESSSERGIAWAMKRKPMLECKKTIHSMISKIIDSKNINSSQFLVKYSISIEWLFLLWSFHHQLPKEVLFYSKSKFNLTESTLMQSECIRLGIDLATKTYDIIQNFVRSCKPDKVNVVDALKDLKNELTFKNKHLEDSQKLVQSSEARLESAQQNNSPDLRAREYDLERAKNRAQELENGIKQLNTQQNNYIELFKSAFSSLSDELLDIRRSEEFRELGNLSKNNDLEIFNGLIKLISDSSDDVIYDSNDVNGTCLDFTYYYRIFAPYFKKIIYQGVSNDSNHILLLFLSIFFIKMKQSSIEMNKQGICLGQIDDNFEINSSNLNDTIYIFYDSYSPDSSFSLAILDDKSTPGTLKIHVYNPRNIQNVTQWYETFVKKHPGDIIEKVQIDLKQKNNRNSNADEFKNANIYSVAAIVRHALANQYDFNDALSLTVDEFNENLSSLVDDLLKYTKPATTEELDFSNPNTFINHFKKLNELLMKNLNIDENEIAGLYEQIINTSRLIMRVQSQLTKNKERLFSNFKFDSISECTIASSKLNFYRNNERYRNSELVIHLKQKLDEILETELNLRTLGIFNQFRDKIKNTIAYISKYFMESERKNYKANYSQNYCLIELFDKFIKDLFKCFHFEGDKKKLTIVCPFNQDYFNNIQAEFDKLCEKMDIPRQLLLNIQFDEFFKRIGEEINEVKTDKSKKNVEPGQQTDESRVLSEIKQLKKMLDAKLKVAHQLNPPPQELISKMRDLFVEISNLKENEVTQAIIGKYNSDVRKLLNEVDEYDKRSAALDYYLKLFPKINFQLEIPSLSKELFVNEFNFNPNHDAFDKLEVKLNELKKLENEYNKAGTMKLNLKSYKILLRMNVKIKLWKRLLENVKEHDASSKPIQSLFKNVDVLSDKLYYSLKSNSIVNAAASEEERNNKIKASVLENFTLFRRELFESDLFFNNYVLVQEVCESPRKIIEKGFDINLLNLFDALKFYSKQTASDFLELKSYSSETCFTLLPFFIEYTDLVGNVFSRQNLAIEYLAKVEAATTIGTNENLFIKNDLNDNESLGGMYYVSKGSNRMVSFVNDALKEKILRFILDVSKSNSQQRTNINNIRVNSPGYQVYLSFFGLCVTSILFKAIDYDDYIRNEIEMEINEQNELATYYNELKETEEKKKAAVNSISGLNRDIEGYKNDLRTLQRDNFQLTQEYDDIKALKDKKELELMKLETDIKNYVDDIDCIKMRTSDTENKIKEIRQKKAGELKDNVKRVECMLFETLKVYADKIGSLINVKTDSLPKYPETVDLSIQCYSQFLNEIFVEIVSCDKEINLSTNNLKIMNDCDLLNTIKKIYSIRNNDILFIGLFKIRDLIKAYDLSLKNSIEALKVQNKRNNQEKDSLNLVSKIFKTIKNVLANKIKELLEISSQPGILTKEKNDEWNLTCANSMENIKTLEDLVEKMPKNSLSQLLFDNLRSFVFNNVDYFKLLLKTTHLILINADKINYNDPSNMNNPIMQIQTKTVIPVDNIKLIDLQKSLISQLPSVFEGLENYDIEITYDYHTNPFHNIQDFEYLYKKYDENILRLCLSSKKLLDHFIDLSKCMLDSREHVKRALVICVVDFIEKFQQFLQQFRYFIDGTFDSKLFCDLVYLYKNYCIYLTADHPKMFERNKESNNNSVIQQLLLVGKIYFGDIYRIIGQSFKNELNEYLRTRKDLVTKYDLRFTEFWLKEEGNINWNMFDYGDSYNLSEFKWLVINKRPETIDKTNLKESTELIEEYHLKVNILFDGFMKSVEDSCNFFEESYFGVDNLGLVKYNKEKVDLLKGHFVEKIDKNVKNHKIFEIVNKFKGLNSIVTKFETNYIIESHFDAHEATLRAILSKVDKLFAIWELEKQSMLMARNTKRKKGYDADMVVIRSQWEAYNVALQAENIRIRKEEEKFAIEVARIEVDLDDILKRIWVRAINDGTYRSENDIKKIQKSCYSWKVNLNDIFQKAVRKYFNSMRAHTGYFESPKPPPKVGLPSIGIDTEKWIELMDFEHPKTLIAEHKLTICGLFNNGEKEIYEYSKKYPIIFLDQNMPFKFKLHTYHDITNLFMPTLEGESAVLTLSSFSDERKTRIRLDLDDKNEFAISLQIKNVLSKKTDQNYSTLETIINKVNTITNRIDNLQKPIKNTFKEPKNPDECEKQYNERLIQMFNYEQKKFEETSYHMLVKSAPVNLKNAVQTVNELNSLTKTNTKNSSIIIKLESLFGSISSLKNDNKSLIIREYVVYDNFDDISLDLDVDKFQTKVTKSVIDNLKLLYKQAIDAVHEITFQSLSYMQHKLCIDSLAVKRKQDLTDINNQCNKLSAIYKNKDFIHCLLNDTKLLNKSFLFLNQIKSYSSYLTDKKSQEIEKLERIIQFSKPFNKEVKFDLSTPFSKMPIPNFTYLILNEEGNYLKPSTFSQVIDFGTVALSNNEDSVRHAFHILNNSRFNLTLRFEKCANYDEIFQFSSANEIIVPANYDSIINIQMKLKNQQTIGLYKSNIKVLSNRIVEKKDGKVIEKTIDVELTANVQKLDVTVSKDEIDFGNVLSSDNKTLVDSFFVTNNTNLMVNTKAEIENHSNLKVTLNKQEFTLMPNSNEKLFVNLNPNKENGPIESSIKLHFNTALTKTVKVKSNFIEPLINIKDENDHEIKNNHTILFDDTEPDSQAISTLKIYNTGNIKVSIQVLFETDANDFKISKRTITLLPGKHEHFTIIFIPLVIGDKSAQIAFKYSTDKKLRINLQGRSFYKKFDPIYNIELNFDSIKELQNAFKKGKILIKDKIKLYNTGNSALKVKLHNSRLIKGFDFVSMKPNQLYVMPTIEYKLLSIQNIQDTVIIETDAANKRFTKVPLKINIKKPTMIIEPLGAIFWIM